jgi:ornithine decarboxylase
VYCRILADGAGADWPLSRKFGCAPATAADLLLQARALGLQPVGISFHVGSQQRDPSRWDDAIATVGKLFAQLASAGLPLELINLGGGLPARHRGRTPALSAYAAAITTAVAAYFPRAPRMIVEPGRCIVGDAGTIVAEVVLISHKEHGDERRWVYLDIGKFGGLPETADEAIRYRITTDHEVGPEGPVVIAGPTCDSMDVLYERADYRMPLDLAIGDRVLIHGTGAYTASYCSVGFNGFPPLKSWFVGTGA